MGAWLQILQIVGNLDYLIYYLTPMTALGLSSYGIPSLLLKLELWEKFE